MDRSPKAFRALFVNSGRQRADVDIGEMLKKLKEEEAAETKETVGGFRRSPSSPDAAAPTAGSYPAKGSSAAKADDDDDDVERTSRDVVEEAKGGGSELGDLGSAVSGLIRPPTHPENCKKVHHDGKVFLRCKVHHK